MPRHIESSESPSRIISPEQSSAKRTKWQKEGYNPKEIQELTKILLRRGEIKDWFQEQVLKGEEYWLDPNHAKERKKAEQTRDAYHQEEESSKARVQEMRQTLAERKQAEADEQRQRELRERIAKGELTPLQEQAMKKAQELQNNLNSRAKELDPDTKLNFSFSSPEVPPDFTEAHFEIIKQVFGQNLEASIVPTPEELYGLSPAELTEYRKLRFREFEAAQDPKKHKPLSTQEQAQLQQLTAKLEACANILYPKLDQARQAKDAAEHQGLVSYRPDYFDQASDANITGSNETWGQAFMRSMHEELQTLGGSLVLVETTQKPNYTDGKQHYGTKEGDDATKDPLLNLFKQAFGSEANRFNHSWDDLQTNLIPKIKEHIIKQFRDKKIPVPNFDVILAPASLSNLQMTLSHPENSTTDTWEWTSTQLSDIRGKDSGHRLDVGYSVYGGAAIVDNDHRSFRNDYWGVRFAVVRLSAKRFPPAVGHARNFLK